MIFFWKNMYTYYWRKTALRSFKSLQNHAQSKVRKFPHLPYGQENFSCSSDKKVRWFWEKQTWFFWKKVGFPKEIQLFSNKSSFLFPKSPNFFVRWARIFFLTIGKMRNFAYFRLRMVLERFEASRVTFNRIYTLCPNHSKQGSR